MIVQAAHPACPNCVWLDYSIGAQAVGSLQYRFGSGGDAAITTHIALPAAYPGSWNRDALPLTPLVPPQQ